MKVKLPAEEQDRLMRPAYITYNDSGALVCKNRYVKVYSSSQCSDSPACGVPSIIKNCREHVCARQTLVFLQIQRD